jgi:hypothetical protein
VRLDDKADATALEHASHDGRLDRWRQGLNEAQSGGLEEAEVVDLGSVGRAKARRSQVSAGSAQLGQPRRGARLRRTLLTWLPEGGKQKVSRGYGKQYRRQGAALELVDVALGHDRRARRAVSKRHRVRPYEQRRTQAIGHSIVREMS